jgi:hypothetical protein
MPPGQMMYIKHYVDTFFAALESDVDSVDIDFDAVADAAAQGLE